MVLPSTDVQVGLVALVFDHFYESPGDVAAEIQRLFPEDFANYFLISVERVQNVSVRFRQNRTLSTHEEVVWWVATASLGLWRAGYSGGEAAISYLDVRHVIRALDQFTDAYEFKVDFMLMEVGENQTMYEDSTEQASFANLKSLFCSSKLSMLTVLNVFRWLP